MTEMFSIPTYITYTYLSLSRHNLKIIKTVKLLRLVPTTIYNLIFHSWATIFMKPHSNSNIFSFSQHIIYLGILKIDSLNLSVDAVIIENQNLGNKFLLKYFWYT